MHIALVVKPGHPASGVARYARELEAALLALGHQVTPVYPLVPFPSWLVRLVKRIFGWDLAAFFLNYPLWVSYPPADLYHLASQNLATLLLFRPPPGPAVVTVHDLLPRLLPRHGLSPWLPLFDRLACLGLRRAACLICPSAFTQACLVRELGFPPERTFTIPLGVDSPPLL
jgi:glycosyltransferase involved in cell wall biosynthesis